LENTVSRIILTCCFAALLGSCGAQRVNNIDLEHARLACADLGIAPGSSTFDQCASNLYYSLWQKQNMYEN
jgi:hypothetical protein